MIDVGANLHPRFLVEKKVALVEKDVFLVSNFFGFLLIYNIGNLVY